MVGSTVGGVWSGGGQRGGSKGVVGSRGGGDLGVVRV